MSDTTDFAGVEIEYVCGSCGETLRGDGFDHCCAAWIGQLRRDRDHWKANHDEQVRRKDEVHRKLSHWIRLFNRLEKAVSNHEKAKAGTGFTDDADEALHAAWKRVMRDACAGDS